MLAAVVAAAAVFLVVLQLLPPTADRRGTSQLTAQVGVGVRAKEIREKNESSYDDAYETCQAAGLAALGSRFHISKPTPKTIARRFSLAWDPAFRIGPYHGCLDGLLNPAMSPSALRSS